jgi:ABC-type polysaccharide/polyol phosphate transport system ATPase subunit
VLGIIGANGAGKSTLLKIITGVLDATSGSVDVSGRVTAILELGLGFNPEHSGRENVYLSGMLYGMPRAEIDRKFEAIVDFSGLRAFIEQPVKTYSSGMGSRLAFSIATAVDPEILIIDEALAAGDAMFVQKSMRRIRQLCSGGRTVLVVSHGTTILAQLCRNVLWLEGGRVKMYGSALPVVQAYDLAAHQGADIESWIETAEDAALGSVEPHQDATPAEAIAPITVHTARSDEEPLADHAPTGQSGTATLIVDTLPDAITFDTVTTIANEEEPPAIADAADKAEAATVSAEAPPSSTPFVTPARHNVVGETQVETGKSVLRRGPIFIDSVTMLNHAGEPSTRLTTVRPFALRIAYHCKGPLPKETLGIAIAINRLADLEPVVQWNTQFIRPDETADGYEKTQFRVKASRRGTIDLAFGYTPFRQDDYLLSIGLLPNAPGTWEFYEYRHLFYPFHVADGGFGLGAPIFFEPSDVKFADRHAATDDEEAPV